MLYRMPLPPACILFSLKKGGMESRDEVLPFVPCFGSQKFSLLGEKVGGVGEILFLGEESEKNVLHWAFACRWAYIFQSNGFTTINTDLVRGERSSCLRLIGLIGVGFYL